MSAYNIYDIDNWQQNTNYTKDYIVKHNELYYYSAFNHTSSSSFTTDLNNGLWNGYIYNRGDNMPYFTWKHSFKASNKNVPKVKNIEFNGYVQRLPDGINSLLLDYTLTFENRSLSEITAILHFLSARNGTQSFCWLPPAPRTQLCRMVCQEWSDIQEFMNNYSVTANFVQSSV